MHDDAPSQVRRALLALSSLATSREGATLPGTIPLDWFRWLPVSGVRILTRLHPTGPRLTPVFPSAEGLGTPAAPLPIDRDYGERLQAVDQLRPTRRNLRVGWLFVAGSTTDERGRRRKIFWPLVSRPVSVSRSPLVGPAYLTVAGDTEVTARIADPMRRNALDGQIQLGGGALNTAGISVDDALLRRMHRLHDFAVSAADACGWAVDGLVAADDGPGKLMQRDGLVVVAGFASFTNVETGGLSTAATLGTWAEGRLDEWSAFHSLYADVPEPPGATGRPDLATPPESPFLLSPAQRHAVETSRDAPVTVISGAPGTGKSHTITAIACDAVARGERVLVAARSEATIDALIELFERAPGPQPVVFGSNERKDDLAARLATGLRTEGDEAVARAREELDVARARRDAVQQSIRHQLVVEQLSDGGGATEAVRRAWPALFAPGVDLGAARRLADEVGIPTTGWWSRRRRRRTIAALLAVTGATEQQLPDLAQALEVAHLARDRDDLIAGGGLHIGSEWDELRRVDDEVRTLAAKAIDRASRGSDRLDRHALGAVAALATALRSGRAARRQQLARMDDALTRALPLWVGTLDDIDDLLPSTSGLFDLVILDEASSIDQPSAATALLRGRRATIVGDPRQLRHVSFVGDDQRDQALVEAGIELTDPVAATLDVRRNSAFDVAAGRAPVLTLDEHFRCRPHLVEFVAHRLYGGAVRVATRSPVTASVDCVDLQPVEGRRDDTGVVAAEVAAVLAEVHRLRRARVTSVGVVTPFRAQADALEAAVLDAFTADDIEVLGLRVGTVHAFQGNERDTVIVSLGIGEGAHPTSWRFAQDPHLVAVMMTRARQRLLIVHAGDPPPDDLLAAYLAQADAPPGPPKPVAVEDEWTRGLAEELDAIGLTVVSGYPTGRDVVDICIGDERGFIGIESAVHPDGPDAHIDRHLALARRGWPLIDAYPSRWIERRGELVVELSHALPSDGSAGGA